MDLIPEAVDYLLEMHALNIWVEGIGFIKGVAAKPSNHWLLPEAACLAVGGFSQQAIPAVAAMMALHTSIVMVDDLLDNDGHFEQMGLHQGDIANLSLTLSSVGLDAICRSSANPENQQLILTYLNHMMVTTALGQYWDAHTIITNEADYWRITRTKSAPFFGAALYTGALMGGASPEIAIAFLDLGFIFGEMIQIHDDLKDTLNTPVSVDWSEHRCSLPILFAQTVNHPDQEKFIRLHSRISDPDALEKAQNILFRSGAVSYCTYQLNERYKSARKLIDKTNLIDPESIINVFQKVIDPVIQLCDHFQEFPLTS